MTTIDGREPEEEEFILIMPGPTTLEQQELSFGSVHVSHVAEAQGTAGVYVDAHVDPEDDGVTLFMSRAAALRLANELWATVGDWDLEEAAA